MFLKFKVKLKKKFIYSRNYFLNFFFIIYLIERLVDTLRMPQSGPGIHAQVFLCFRVLLLRMSGHHITSMWPIIVSEMVQVMIHIEHNLSTDSEEFRYVIISLILSII